MRRESESFAERRSFELPFSLGTVVWQPTMAQRRAAWKLYLELGDLPGALSRLDRVLDEEIPPKLVLAPFAQIGHATHRVLARAGPQVGDRPTSFGQIALRVNKRGFRPFVERWGTRLQVYGAARPLGMPAATHELMWPELRNFVGEAHLCYGELRAYRRILEEMAGVIVEADPQPRPRDPSPRRQRTGPD